MVASPGKFQARFTAGELDPLMSANTEIKSYLTGAALMRNARPIPQGGFTLMNGTRQIARVRNCLSDRLACSASGYAVVACAANAATEILRLTLNVSQNVTAVDIIDFAFSESVGVAPSYDPPISGTAATGILSVEIFDGAQWMQWRQFVMTRTRRTRRLSLDAGKKRFCVAVRIVAILPITGVAWIGEAGVYAESDVLSRARIRSFAHSRDQAYDLIQTGNNFDVFSLTGRTASISSPFSEAQSPAVNFIQHADTAILCHQDVAPRRIIWQGGDEDWTISKAPFANIPNFDYGEVYSNSTPAVWALSFFNGETGNHFTITVNGNTSRAATLDPDPIEEIRDLLGTIPGLNPGWTVSKGVTPSGCSIPNGYYGIEFSGKGNEGDGWSVSAKVVDNGNAAITSSHLQVGKLGGEPIISDSRGWPTCGLFYAGRLLVAGLKSAPNYILASQIGDYWNFDTRLISSAGAMSIPIDTEGAAIITCLHKGRTLYVFTDAGEYWLSGNSLDRTQTPNIVFASKYGSFPGIRPVEVDGSSIYVDRSGGALMAFQYDMSQQNYLSSNISVQASSLAKNIIDLAKRRATDTTDTTEIAAVRADGIVVCSYLLAEQEIRAFTRRETDGLFQSVCVNERKEMSFVVKRRVGNSDAQFFERAEPGLLLDQALNVSVVSGQTKLNGLSDYEGAEIWAIVDQSPQGPFRVIAGCVDLRWPALTAGVATVGRWTPPLVRTLPQPREIGPRTVVRRPARVHSVKINVVNTSSIAIRANDGNIYDCPLRKFGDPADVPLLAKPFTGIVSMQGLTGFSDDAAVEITQVRPGTLTVIGLTTEVEL